MKSKFYIIILLLCAACVFSQTPTYNYNLLIKEPFTPEKFEMGKEYTPYVSVFLPEKEKATGRAVIVCPGGAYAMVAFGHEGLSWSKFFNPLGIAVLVVNYRLPKGDHTIPVSDVKSAYEILVANAKNWNVNLDDVGIMGSSAGGHLASTVATHPKEAFRPAFQILFYPVISMDNSFTHQGSRENLLGKNPSDEMVKKYSNELQVTSTSPPAFIVAAEDDQTVPIENSIRYFEALRKEKVPASLHIYPRGNHGWGYKTSYEYNAIILEELNTWISGLKINQRNSYK